MRCFRILKTGHLNIIIYLYQDPAAGGLAGIEATVVVCLAASTQQFSCSVCVCVNKPLQRGLNTKYNFDVSLLLLPDTFRGMLSQDSVYHVSNFPT